jgi:hypothetical protein
MNRLIPKPTPQDIEASLTAIRNGTNSVYVWVQLYGQVIEKRDLWWVTIISPARPWRWSDLGRGGGGLVDFGFPALGVLSRPQRRGLRQSPPPRA